MKIERTQYGDVTVLRLAGDLNEGVVPDLRQALYNCLAEDRVRLVINMAEVGFISYMSLGIVVERLRLFRSRQGDIKLVGVNVYAQRLFRMTGIKNMFETFDSEPQAAQAFGKAA